MKRLAVLFFVIAMTHIAYDPLSMIFGSPQEWFYILRGIEGATVFAMLAKAQASLLWIGVCLWGAGVGAAKELILDTGGRGDCSLQDFAVTAIAAGVSAYTGGLVVTRIQGRTLVAYAKTF